MGIAEKRVLEQYKEIFQKKELPKLQTVGGLKLSVDVSWDDIYGQLDGAGIDELTTYMTEVFITPVTASLESICADDLGTGLIKKVLKKIKFCCSADIDQKQKAFTFKDGTLTVDHSMRKLQSYDTDERTEYLTMMIEDML